MADKIAPTRTFARGIVDLLRKKVPAAFLLALLFLLLIPYLLKYLNRQKPDLEMPSSQRSLTIKELISDLKTELGQMEEERIKKNESAAFEIINFDLEISFMVRASSQQRAGIEYQIVTADSEIQQGVEKIQKLTVHLKPIGNPEIPAKHDSSLDESGTELVDRAPPGKESKP